MVKNSRHRYTKAEEEWLRENISKHQYSELTQLFNQKFDTNASMQSIKDKCSKGLKLKRGVNTGQITVEKRKCGKYSNAYPIGTERIYDGYVYVKIQHTYTKGKKTNEDFRKDWKAKQRYIYEKHHGKISDKQIVIFLDNNCKNFEIDNLYALNRSIHAQMCSNDWYTNNKEATLTAIRLCELQRKLR